MGLFWTSVRQWGVPGGSQQLEMCVAGCVTWCRGSVTQATAPLVFMAALVFVAAAPLVLMVKYL